MKENILHKVDHTLLNQTATWEEIKELCEDAIKYQTASVCIPPLYVSQARKYVGDRMKICTVIGFPNGYMTTETKKFEIKDALKKVADEIDMVIPIGKLKSKKDTDILEEIRTLKDICQNHILKVIIETCLLTKEEKIRMCEIVTESGADFIKTSTGFSEAGAVFEDIALLREHIGNRVKIKAAGGIASFEDAERFVELGASRLGTSRLVKIMKDLENKSRR